MVFCSCNTQKNKEADVNKRVNDLVSKMTLEEKIDFITGNHHWKIHGNKRLNIPNFNMSNGPVGVRPLIRTPLYPVGVHDSSKATAFPASIAMAASWNKELIEQTGSAMAKESRWKNIHCLLGPGMNIQRVPYGGRNFEYLSEDPYLNAMAGISIVKGIQREGVLACVKHYACNNSEYKRHTVNIKVAERPLHEIYLYAYKKVVEEANPYMFMSAYNKVNGTYSAENNYLQNVLLKDKWGFRGFIVSDWGATRRADDPATNGLDLEMPRAATFGDKLLKRVQEGEVKAEIIDEKVGRILWSMIHSGVFDNYDQFQIPEPETKKTVNKAGAEGMVLLKNENNMLPLDKNKIQSIAVIGPNAPFMRTGGWGSSYICPTETVSPLEGLKQFAGNGIEIIDEPGIIRRKDIVPVPNHMLKTPDNSENGLKAEYFNNIAFEGKPVLERTEKNVAVDWKVFAPHEGVNEDNFSVRWTGWLTPEETSDYYISLSADEGCRLYVNDKKIIDTWDNHDELSDEYLKKGLQNYLRQYPTEYIVRTPGFLKARKPIVLEKGKPYKIRIEYKDESWKAACAFGLQKKGHTSVAEAAKAAAEADAAVIFAGISFYEEREAKDLPSILLPEGQEELIQEVAKANPNTIVVLNNGTALDLSNWSGQVPAILEAWYPGQYGGEVIADVLFGNINPSGKLPITFMKKWEDTPVADNFPAPDFTRIDEADKAVDEFLGRGDDNTELVYSEGIYVGYRHYDKHNIEPLFAFGHGLSYTSFEFDGLEIDKKGDKIYVACELKNTGSVAGAEVVQLYVHDVESSLDRPVKELKGFEKVYLEPGETAEVKLMLEKDDLAFYDPAKHQWVVEPGEFKVMLGSSSRDIRLAGTFDF